MTISNEGHFTYPNRAPAKSVHKADHGGEAPIPEPRRWGLFQSLADHILRVHEAISSILYGPYQHFFKVPGPAKGATCNTPGDLVTCFRKFSASGK